MSNKGILFSEPLIPSLLDLSKTMTRRVINPTCPEMSALLINMSAGCDIQKNADELVRVYSPWSVDDILFVREVTYVYGWWEELEGKFTQAGKPKLKFFEDPHVANWYTSESRPFPYHPEPEYHKMPGWHKRPGLFMKRHRARIFLKVFGVYPERLQQISENDARREGMKPNLTAMRPAERATAHTAEFIRTIKGIHGPEIWDANPWMWVLSFKRVDKPANWQ